MSSIFKNIRTYLNQPVHTSGFAAFRIGFAMFLLVFIAHVTYFKPLIFNTIPVIAPNPVPANLFLGFWACAAFALLLGFKTRFAALLNYVLVIIAAYTFSSSGCGSFNDDLLRIGSFLMLIMPVSGNASIDSVIYELKYGVKPNRNTTQLTIIAFLFVSLGLMYWASSLTKLYSPMWTKGLGLWIPSVMPYNKWHNVDFYLNQKWAMMACSYFTVVWEFLFIFSLFSKKLRPYFAWLGIIFHIVLALIFPFPLICFGPLPFYFVLIPHSFWMRFSKKPLQIALNPTIKSQLFFSRIISAFHPQVTITAHPSTQISINNQPFASNWQAAIVAIKKTYVGLLLFWLVKIKTIRLLLLFIANDVINLSQISQSKLQLISPNLKRQALIVFSLALLFMQTFYSSYHLYSRAKGAITTEEYKKYYHVRKDITDFSLKPSNLFRTLFGLNARGVFLDHSNLGKKTVFAIVKRKPNGTLVFLPFFSPQGYCLGFNLNLSWSKYSFNSVCSGTIPNPFELEKVIWFWAKKRHVKLDSLDLYILKREYQFPKAFEENYHQKLIDQPWEHEGMVTWRKGKFKYHSRDSLLTN